MVFSYHKAHSEDSDQTGRTCHFVGFIMMRLSCLNISNFFKHLSRELALKGNKNHLLGSTNLLVKTAQFTKQILLIISSVSHKLGKNKRHRFSAATNLKKQPLEKNT